MTHTKDEAQPAPVQDPWQPISSAPKDGTRILCKDVEGFVDICEWTPDASGGRFTSSDDRTFGGGPAYTSWMSLPQPIQSTPPAAQPAQQEPINVAQAYAMAQVCLDLHDALGCKWGDNPYLAIDRLKTTPPASWMEMVTANLVREGVNKHKARELAGHFYGLAAPIPDAITDNSESPEYRAGWNECRELTIQMRKS